jgi:hypothetical protein
MKQAEEKPRWYFVDEAGDPAFYAKGSRKVIVGEEGCSRTLILGFIRTLDPQQIRSKLAEVRLAVSTDRYLNDIPSVKKSLIYFHAKDDCAEVRKLVFDALDKMDFHAQFIVARKRETLFRTKYGSSQAKFYDDLVTSCSRTNCISQTRTTLPLQDAGIRRVRRPCGKLLKRQLRSSVRVSNTRRLRR